MCALVEQLRSFLIEGGGGLLVKGTILYIFLRPIFVLPSLFQVLETVIVSVYFLAYAKITK